MELDFDVSKYDCVSLFSGGIDSFAATWAYIRNGASVMLLTVYSHPREFTVARRMAVQLPQGAIEHVGYEFHFPEPEEDGYVRNRNLFYISLAATIGPDKIITGLGVTDAVAYPDASIQFCRDTSSLVSAYGPKDLKVVAPMTGKSKSEVYEYLRERTGEDYAEVIWSSSSCIANPATWKQYEWGAGCGECEKCAYREKITREFLDNP